MRISFVGSSHRLPRLPRSPKIGSDDPDFTCRRRGDQRTGFVMVEQIKSIDFRARRAKRIGRAPTPVLEEALSILDACIY